MTLAQEPAQRPTALNQADTRRQTISPTLDPERRSKLGQYMTPAPVATFMSQMFDTLPEDVQLLDAGAGVGSLSAAFVHEVCQNRPYVRSIDLTAFEVDPVLREQLEATLSDCESECRVAGISFTFRVISEDYILNAAEPLLAQQATPNQYNCAILNPPYAKINSNSITRRALREMGIETTNLYTAFVAVALLQLEDQGQLVAITPRSFCNGTYFEPFRRLMFERASLCHVHVYDSRKHAFKEDDVLQENIIYRLVGGEPQAETITISSSHSPADLNPMSREIPFNEVVVPNDKHCYIRLAVSEEDGTLAIRVRALPHSLADLGIKVSTGRVVDFRAREHLRKDPEPGTVPLIYPSHFDNGYVSWPKLGGKKANALADNEDTAKLMVPKGIYVLTKRFSSKEEKRRLVATIYDPERVDAEKVGFENHLNYFHIDGKGLERALAKGLLLFFNSTAVDQYFRQFSGHTQVNATDLRNLHYPTVERLDEVGRRIGDELPPQEEIDEIVETLLV
ncbi:Eco57I restriction-modification methylase domain-containing protein [Halomonas salifodinae]|uniref:Eco57I restriction-modification methylase domain-containing protein n=1 Tax=Halomonas salifodinae TaxID=438745 RepID=UPI0033A24C60